MIEVRTSCGSYAIGIAAGGGVRVNLTPFYQRFAAMLEGVEISAVRPGVISLKWGERTRVTNVDGLDDMARIAARYSDGTSRIDAEGRRLYRLSQLGRSSGRIFPTAGLV